VKEKLRKHNFSIFFAFVWSLGGLVLLSWIALTFFPFIESERIVQKAGPLLSGAAVFYIIMALLLARLRTFPYANKPLVVNFVVTITGSILFMALAAARVYFSLGFLATYFIFTNIWFSLEAFLRARFSLYILAVVRGGYPIETKTFQNLKLVPFDAPDTLPSSVDGVVLDFEKELSKDWIDFVAKCVMEGIPVISSDDFVETQTGTIILANMTTARSISFQKASLYPVLKRFLDLLLAVCFSPLWVPILIITAIAVKLESPGPAIFSQKRVGRRGKAFTIYKIRSMRSDSEKHGAAFASVGDARVTRIGAFIRKFRIDEFPQFFNIIRGDMSLIGPRPEQVSFVDKFNEDIPYYQLRHMVRPGITGWAQITQGYAAGTDETAVKLAHDLYYVKHLSFVLDFLITIRTIGTILTGFGSR